jgi:hypothetical protein
MWLSSNTSHISGQDLSGVAQQANPSLVMGGSATAAPEALRPVGRQRKIKKPGRETAYSSPSEAAAALLFFSVCHWPATESAAIVATKLNPNVALCFAEALSAGARRRCSRLAVWTLSGLSLMPHGVARSAKVWPVSQPARTSRRRGRHLAGGGLSTALFGIWSGLWQAGLGRAAADWPHAGRLG